MSCTRGKKTCLNISNSVLVIKFTYENTIQQDIIRYTQITKKEKEKKSPLDTKRRLFVIRLISTNSFPCIDHLKSFGIVKDEFFNKNILARNIENISRNN